MESHECDQRKCGRFAYIYSLAAYRVTEPAVGMGAATMGLVLERQAELCRENEEERTDGRYQLLTGPMCDVFGCVCCLF